MARKMLTPAQRDEIAVLRGDQGWSYRKIAAKLGVSTGGVMWRCLVDGIDKPGAPPPPSNMPMVKMRRGRPVRRFTSAEDAALLYYEKQGLSACEIGRRLGRKHNSVTGRLATLARQDEREEPQ